MGTLHIRPLRCERARRWASLGLDGELSQLEQAMLARHLDACPECARFAVELRSLATALRTAAGEAPGRPLAPARPREERRVPVPFLRVAAVAAAVVGALGLAGSAERAGGPGSASDGVAAHSGPDTDAQIRDLRQRELRASVDGTTLRRDLLLPL